MGCAASSSSASSRKAPSGCFDCMEARQVVAETETNPAVSRDQPPKRNPPQTSHAISSSSSCSASSPPLPPPPASSPASLRATPIRTSEGNEETPLSEKKRMSITASELSIPAGKSGLHSSEHPPMQPVAIPHHQSEEASKSSIHKSLCSSIISHDACLSNSNSASFIGDAATNDSTDYDLRSLGRMHDQLNAKHNVFRICLTGGPCAGKSTVLSQIQTKIPLRTGFKVYCVPEAATMLVGGGLEWDGKYTVQQQLALLNLQMALEDQFYRIAVATGKPSVIISDRGTMDGRAFCTTEQFDEILALHGGTMEALRDRYDAVMHLVTCAIGAEAYYNMDNPARYETLSGAVESDVKLRQMYVGHPRLRILDNSTCFEEKVERALQFVGQVLGQRFPVKHSTYYLLRRAPSELPSPAARSTQTITVLNHSNLDGIRLIIKRDLPSRTSLFFFHSIKRAMLKSSSSSKSRKHSVSEGSRRDGVEPEEEEGALSTTPSTNKSLSFSMEEALLSLTAQAGLDSPSFNQHSSDPNMLHTVRREQRISAQEYASLLEHRDVTRMSVVADALHFLCDDYCCEVTTIRSPSWAAGKTTITVECENPHTITMPPFIELERELPIEQLSAAFLISHKETGPLYTSLTFAPTFLRTSARDHRRSVAAPIIVPDSTAQKTPSVEPPLAQEASAAKEPSTSSARVSRSKSTGSRRKETTSPKRDNSRASSTANFKEATPPPAPPTTQTFTRRFSITPHDTSTDTTELFPDSDGAHRYVEFNDSIQTLDDEASLKDEPCEQKPVVEIASPPSVKTTPKKKKATETAAAATAEEEAKRTEEISATPQTPSSPGETHEIISSQASPIAATIGTTSEMADTSKCSSSSSPTPGKEKPIENTVSTTTTTTAAGTPSMPVRRKKIVPVPPPFLTPREGGRVGGGSTRLFGDMSLDDGEIRKTR